MKISNSVGHSEHGQEDQKFDMLLCRVESPGKPAGRQQVPCFCMGSPSPSPPHLVNTLFQICPLDILARPTQGVYFSAFYFLPTLTYNWSFLVESLGHMHTLFQISARLVKQTLIHGVNIWVVRSYVEADFRGLKDFDAAPRRVASKQILYFYFVVVFLFCC